MALDEVLPDDTTVYRNVDLIINGQPTSDGAGVRLTRYIGSPDLNHLDPFLLLDFGPQLLSKDNLNPPLL